MAHFPELLHETIAWAGAQLTRGPQAMQPSVGVAALAALVLGLFVVVRVFRSKARRPMEGHAAALAEMTRYPRRLGLAAGSLFVLVLAAWSVAAPLASAALAPGVISPDGHRKTIQHLEGGIIRAIHVREGDAVEAGEPLITLDDTKAKALNAELRERLLHLLATEARLEAERTDAAQIRFPAMLLEESAELRQVMDGQRQLYLSRRAAHQGRLQVLEARIRQLEEQNSGLKEMVAAENEQLALVDEEIRAVQQLLDKGLERKPRILALKRGRADIAASKAANRAKIAENAQAMGETRLQLLTIGEERQEKIGAELAEIRRVLAEVKGQLPSREDILQRTVIRAPIGGAVMNLRVNTETGVIGAGEPLLDIVPDGSNLIIDARVRPTDIERIRPGMSARVVLTAYRQRNLPLIQGALRSISADAMTDERTGSSYFVAKVEVRPEDLARLEEVKLVPGMPAEVMLMDGEQSVLAYLLGPIIDSARRSLREN